MNDERERGFARATAADLNDSRPDTNSFDEDLGLPNSGTPDSIEQVRPDRQEFVSEQERLIRLSEAAATEQELLMNELHDPMGIDPRRPTQPLTSAHEAELRALRDKLYKELAEYAPTQSEEQPKTTKSNLFAALGTQARDVARKHVRPVAKNHMRRLVIGAALVVAAGLVIGEARDRADTPPAGAVVGLGSNFGTVRSIVREPGQFLRNGLAAELGEDYARGAAGAEIALHEEAFAAVTDPEARIAIASSAVERALIVRDTRSLAIWLRRLAAVEGAEEDPRVAIIREKGYRRLAEIEQAAGRDSEARRWRMWAEQEAEKAERHRNATLAGAGWTMGVARQLENSLILARARLPNDAPESYQAGFNAALAEAEQALELMMNVALTPKQGTRTR